MIRLISITFLSVLFSQFDSDPRMIGLSGAYTNIADGFSCVGINPANLSYKQNDFSINLGSVNSSFWNSSLSFNFLNTLNNANMIDSTSVNYYDKQQLKDVFGDRGLVLNNEIKLLLPLINFSIKNWALTSTDRIYAEVGIPTLLLEFLFFFGMFNFAKNIKITNHLQLIW